jgi:hypothetical protein
MPPVDLNKNPSNLVQFDSHASHSIFFIAAIILSRFVRMFGCQKVVVAIKIDRNYMVHCHLLMMSQVLCSE